MHTASGLTDYLDSEVDDMELFLKSKIKSVSVDQQMELRDLECIPDHEKERYLESRKLSLIRELAGTMLEEGVIHFKETIGHDPTYVGRRFLVMRATVNTTPSPEAIQDKLSETAKGLAAIYEEYANV